MHLLWVGGASNVSIWYLFNNFAVDLFQLICLWTTRLNSGYPLSCSSQYPVTGAANIMVCAAVLSGKMHVKRFPIPLIEKWWKFCN